MFLPAVPMRFGPILTQIWWFYVFKIKKFMFIRQATYSKNDPASLVHAAGQGAAIAAGGINGATVVFVQAPFICHSYPCHPSPSQSPFPLPGFSPVSQDSICCLQTNRICPCRKTGSQGLCSSSRRRNTLNMINILQKRIAPAQITA